jgi:hypothetical protein
MKICDRCGNEVEDRAWKCPYCKAHVKSDSGKHQRPSKRAATVNLKEGLPTVSEAIRRLDVKLEAARGRGARVVRVIHGWGSTGSGGRIKAATRRRLRRLEQAGRIKRFVTGETYAESSEDGGRLLKEYPALKTSLRTDSKNPGITFVIL